MENHPIPQDVTGFKFKLIGSITVKQFLYLLGFGILTTVVFAMGGLNIFAKIPLMLLFAGTGAALAFVPIEGRPMDVMMINFAKAIPSENRYIFRKRGVDLSRFEFLKAPNQPHSQAQNAAQAAQNTINEHDEKKSLLLKKLNNSSFKADEEETKFFNNVKSFFSEGNGPAPVQKLPDKMPEMEAIKPQIAPIINADRISDDAPISEPEAPAETIEDLKEELTEAKTMKEEGLASQDMEARIKALEEQLQSSLSEKEALSRKVVEYENDKVKKDEHIFTPAQGGEEPQESKSVHFVPPSASLKAGFPTLPDVPNIVLGIVEDPRGKTLPNVLVEVIDENNIPVRAFKTNALGQFASATPLKNGSYKMYFEDPTKQHEFEIIEINVDGEIFMPIEVKSIDAREKLRRELFDNKVGAAQTTTQ